jgi:hypothetical protein
MGHSFPYPTFPIPLRTAPVISTKRLSEKWPFGRPDWTFADHPMGSVCFEVAVLKGSQF